MTREQYNTIFVIINKLINDIIVLLFKEVELAEQLVYIILNRFVRDYKLPKVIMLDIDKLFILNFQISLTRRLGIKLRMLTVYYLQIDG